MLHHFYRANSLLINSSKTEYMFLDKSINEDDYTILDNEGHSVKPKRIMKILGIRVNKDNNMRNHLDHLNARVTTTYNSLRETIPFMTPENRKIIINSKLRGQVNLFLPLILNQSQQVRKKAETLLMRINKIIYGKKYIKVCNETICKEIQMPDPEIEIVKAGAKAI